MITNRSRLLALLLGVALGVGAPLADAATVRITGVGTRDAGGTLQMGSAMDIGNNRAVLITGYLADTVTRDIGHNGRVILEKTDDLSLWSVPFVNRLWGARVALDSITADTKLDPTVANQLNDAGFLAAADAYTLPAGIYNVKSVIAIFGSANTVTVPVTEQMTITIPAERTTSSMVLTNPSGATVAFTPRVYPTSGDIRLSGYGVQRSGTYTLTTPAFDKWGAAAPAPATFTLDYQRPLAKFDVSNPLGVGFEGFPQTFGVVNPLTNDKLTGALDGEASIEQGTGAPTAASANGLSITGTGVTNVSLPETAATAGGVGSIYAMRVATDGLGGRVRVFLNRPDAPDLQFSVANWNPDANIAVASKKPAYAVGVEPATITAARGSGSRCGLVYEVPAEGTSTAINFGASTVYCAVRWITKPSGLASVVPFPNLGGKLTTVGANEAQYETGVLWKHPVTKEVTFSRAGTHTLTVNGTTPVAPTIRFIADATLVRAGATNLLTYAGTAVPGGVQVLGPYAGLGVRIINDDGATVTGGSRTTSYYRLTNLANSVVGTQRTMNIEAYYTAAPDVVYTRSFTFDVVPRRQLLNLVLPPLAVSTTPLTLRGYFGSPQADGSYAYLPDAQGNWTVQLATVSPKGILTNVGSPVTPGADGSLTFNVGLLEPGIRTFTAVATQTDPAPGTTNTIRGRNILVNTRNGAEIDAYALTTPVIGNGPSPLNAVVGVRPVSLTRFLDIGVVTWEVSEDGTNFTPLLKTDGSPMSADRLLNVGQQLTGDTVRQYRAVVQNRWSNLATTTTPVQLQSFTVPTVQIRSPKYTFVDHPITLQALVADVDPGTLSYRWTVLYGRYDANPVITEGVTSLTITPTKALNDLIIRLDAWETNAPTDNPRAIRHAEVAVIVLPPVLARPSVTGPVIVETGQSYTWNAVQRSPFPPGTETDLVISSRWVLPDGTYATANPVTYEMKPGDLNKIRYESWIEGYPTSLVGTDFALTPWTYQWPGWKMTAAVLQAYAPTARVQFSAGLIYPALLPTLHNEPISYQWTLPEGATLVSQNGGVLVAEFPTAGTYQASVVISDTRGNSTTVDSPAFTVLPPKPLTFAYSLTSGDRWNRPPGPVFARTTVTSLPVNDALRGVTFFIDGVQAGPEVLTGANFNLPNEGTYSIRALMTSVKGVTAEATQTITLTVGDNPACELRMVGDAVNTLAFTSNCTVQRGMIGGYQWKVNGVQNIVSSSSLYFPQNQIANVRTVEVTAVTDKGQRGGSFFDMATRTATPTNP